ncbi:MAG: ATP-grasp domain-containing protein [Muribaculum sp.]|nr:ATP-grasp domain-containing protein [Muribaculum sp.]
MGVETHVFAWEEGAVCKDHADYFYPISITEKELILEKCREIGIDGIVTIASDLAVVTVNYIASQMGLVGNDDAYTTQMTNKYEMRLALAEINPQTVPIPLRQAQLFVPKFIRTNTDRPQFESIQSFPAIVKPTDRSGSRGVTKVYNAEERSKAIGRALAESIEKEVILEEYVDGNEISVESISFNGKHYVLQITDKVTTGEPYFVELEHHQPSSLPSVVQDKIRMLVPLALDALHITNGASHTEIKITPDGELKIIEIGARMGGDFIGSNLVELSTGYDFLKGVIQVALGTFEEPKLTEANHSGVYFISKETESLSQYIDNKAKYLEIVEAERTDSELRNIEESADRSGYFIYKSDQKFICR